MNEAQPADKQPTEDRKKVIKALGEHVSSLQVSLPTNSDGLPLSYVDPQVLLQSGFLDDELNIETMNNAVVPIVYTEGHPVVDGLPLWDRLGGELLGWFNSFKNYRDQKLSASLRSLTKTASNMALPLSYITDLSKAFHWQARAKAFDLYIQMEREATRNRNMVLLENKHYKAANDIFEICMTFIRGTEENPVKLTAKSALGWIETAIKLGRISVGMPPDKSIAVADKANINTIITQVNTETQNIALSASAGDSGKVNVDRLQKILNILIDTGQLARVLEENTKQIVEAPVVEEDGRTENNSSGDERGVCEPATDSANSKDD